MHASCPPREVMQQLLRGDLSDSKTEAVAEHIRDCAPCQRGFDRLQAESPFGLLLAAGAAVSARQSAILEEEQTPAVRALTQRLEQLGAHDSALVGESAAIASDPAGFAFLSPAQTSDELGQLGQFRVLKPLGAGGMGLVFLAEDTRLKRHVALKVLQDKYARRPAARERFLREAQSLAAVKHDNIAVIHEVGETPAADGSGPVSFLAMELLRGQSLAEWMKGKHAPPIKSIIRIGRQAAAGLAVAHAHGLVHRDVKPANLWLEMNDEPGLGPRAAFRVKVLDFGLAAPTDEAAAEIVGTPGYMAPEQLRGDPLDGRCDLFALGCVLYELCTGTLPFPRPVAEIRGRSFDFPALRPIASINPTVPTALARLIHRLLAVKPEARPESARDVERRLERIERRLWFLRQPRWVRWGAAAAALLFAGGLVWGFGPLVTSLVRYGQSLSQPIVVSDASLQANEDMLPGPPDESWLRIVAELPPDRQVASVTAKLRELNAHFKGLPTKVKADQSGVVEFAIDTQDISDIRPLQALTSLRVLHCVGNQFSPGKLKDLSPLADLPLVELKLTDNHSVSDIRSLRRMKLVNLDLSGTSVASLEALDGSQLQELAVSYTQVRDLSPLRNMPRLQKLWCFYCPLESLEPLVGTGIRELNFSYREERDSAVLKKLKLRIVNQGLWRLPEGRPR